MGKEAEVEAVLPDGPDAGRLQFEAPRLIFRGRERRVYEAAALAGLRVDGPDLVLRDGARFTLGARAAAGWADAILNPKSRLEKLGVKPGQRVRVDGVADEAFSAEIAASGAERVEGEPADLLFYGADSPARLAGLQALAAGLAPGGALWIVAPKGRAAPLKDAEVRAAGRAAGLVDTKVVSFSDTRTALRFVRRKA